MLSRIAESLYWIGRYVERAEDTARILDVHVQHLLEAPTADIASTCRVLLDAMGADPPDGPLDARRVTELLGLEPANPSSIVASLAAARNNARGVSEAISSEIWEALNSTYNALPAQVGLARRGGLYAFFRFVRERSAIVAGSTDSTMGRDDAWRFLVLGRSLERTDMVARLLATGISAVDARDVDWVVLLRSCSAHEAFLRTYSRSRTRCWPPSCSCSTGSSLGRSSAPSGSASSAWRSSIRNRAAPVRPTRHAAGWDWSAPASSSARSRT